jgi:hypothetical protein
MLNTLPSARIGLDASYNGLHSCQASLHELLTCQESKLRRLKQLGLRHVIYESNVTRENTYNMDEIEASKCIIDERIRQRLPAKPGR